MRETERKSTEGRCSRGSGEAVGGQDAGMGPRREELEEREEKRYERGCQQRTTIDQYCGEELR